VRAKSITINPAWTFSLWLSFQQKRKDAVGELARLVEADAAWPGWRAIKGLEEYMKEKGANDETLRVLRQAYEEWEKAREGE
jgi:hypothetical protein